MFTTGDKPILVTCSDMSDWVCKHGRLYPSVLFSEVIGSTFAELWDLKTPKISFVNVHTDHLPNEYLNIVQPAFFNKPCFGSLFIEESQVLDKTLLPSFKNQTFRSKIVNKEDLLKIALFDIWLGNEDRHHANSNLLLDQTLPNKYYFNVFDHGAIFNSNTLIHGLQLISDNESIICSDFAQILFRKGKTLTKIVDNVVKDFYLCTLECEAQLSTILVDIPAEWRLDLPSLEVLIRNNLFTANWKSDCENHFRALIQANI
ncbi:HipA family kinase [Flavobacterium hercynium]|nr:HipA family kinase [Flavobacterium hercynium]